MHSIVIFGASGDLTSRKIIPALYQLYRKRRLPEPCHIVGVARTSWQSEAWRDRLGETTKAAVGDPFQQELWQQFAQNIHYHPGDIGNADSFMSLDAFLKGLEAGPADRLYYLATAPGFYAETVRRLADANMAAENEDGTRRVIVEKPFGTDLASAKSLNRSIQAAFDESRIYRIDHYLGKETVNNILVLRFANTIFEPIWNRNFIDHIQITANESGLVGRRAAFYETAGVLRDMFQNHLLQVLTFVTMEAPTRFEAKAVRDEKVKVLQAIRSFSHLAGTPAQQPQIDQNTLRGQYRGYMAEPGVAPESRTATYGAMKLHIDNWRWKDVPVYLRSGKAMSCQTTQILIQFKQPPHCLFQDTCSPTANRLLIQLQPAEGMRIHFLTKIPDTEMAMRMTEFHFHFKDSFQNELPEAYERLLLDALNGNASLFARNDEVEAAWEIIDPVQAAWDARPMTDSEFYDQGTWGPDAAADWIQKDGRTWLDLCPLV